MTNIRLMFADNQQGQRCNVDVARAFNQFWQAYPRKVAKKAARTAFAKAIKIASIDDIMRGLDELVRNSPDDIRFIPHAATWLNGERWTDDYVDNHSRSVARALDDLDRKIMERQR